MQNARPIVSGAAACLSAALLAGAALAHIQAGKMRAIGLSAPQRQPGAAAELPTLKEQGIDAVFYSWRGFLGAKDLTPSQIAFWDAAFAKALQAEDWKQDLAKNAWAEDLRTAAETRKHLDRETEVMKGILTELGLAKH